MSGKDAVWTPLPNPTSMHVLHVGQDTSGLRFRKLILEQRGYWVTTADNASLALEIFALGRFDLILTELPGATASVMVAVIRRLNRRIPIIALSDSAATFPNLEALDACIAKADGPDTLLATIEGLLRRSREMQRSPVTDSANGKSEALQELLLAVGKSSAYAIRRQETVTSAERTVDAANARLPAAVLPAAAAAGSPGRNLR